MARILVGMLIEMIALRRVLWLWNPTPAWILTALRVYSFIGLLGDWRAVCLRPIAVKQDALIVRMGLRWTVRVPFLAIASIRLVKARPATGKTPGYLETVPLVPRSI